MAAEPTADFDFFLPFPLFPPLADADAALAEGIVECTLVVDLGTCKTYL
jgi:hypothetical protein